MIPNYLFGITKRLLQYSKPIRSGWIIDTGGRDYNVAMGTPCFVILSSPRNPEPYRLDSGKTHRIALVPITLNTKFVPRLILDNHNNISKLALCIGPETDFFEKRKETKIDYLNADKFNQALAFVKDTGNSCTLLVRGAKNTITSDLIEVLKPVNNNYKIKLAGYRKAYGVLSTLENDEVFLAVTIMDIRQCVPIFDPKHVDGIVVHCTTIYTERSKRKDTLVSSGEFTLGFSNFSQNIIELYGQRLPASLITTKHVTDIIKSYSEYFGIINQDRLLKKKVNKN